MFLILGLTWTFDVIEFALGSYKQKSIAVYVFTNIALVINSLQGVILFCVIVFNSANLRKIRQWLTKTSNITAAGNQVSSRPSNSINITSSTSISLSHSPHRIRLHINTKKNKDDVMRQMTVETEV